MIEYYFFNKVKKILSKGLNSKGGRNIKGRVCIRGQGGGNKKVYKFIDFFRRINSKGIILNIFYDPNRSARVAAILYLNSLCSFILLQKNVKINDVLYSGEFTKDVIKSGFSVILRNLPLFSSLSNIEFKPFFGSSICRAAGTSCIMIGKTKDKGIIKLNSKWQLQLSLNCMGSCDSISDKEYNNWFIYKAGKNRALGWKPKVRGVAKNPCDHPHGGGNGKKAKPKIPVNAWHTVFKWSHTNDSKKNKLLRRRFKNLNAN